MPSGTVTPAGGSIPATGGTFTGPVEVDSSDGSSVPLGVRASWNAQNADFFAVFNSDTGIDFFAIDSSGSLVLVDHATGAPRGAISGNSGLVSAVGGFSGNPITSGALPNVAGGAPTSGVAFRCSTSRNVHLVVPVTFNPTGSDPATVRVELSPDNVTYSELVTKSCPATDVAGLVDDVSIHVPAGWYVKLTTSNATMATSFYY